MWWKYRALMMAAIVSVSLVIVSSLPLSLNNQTPQNASLILKTFESILDLESFINSKLASEKQSYPYRPTITAPKTAFSTRAEAENLNTPDFSATNIQVEGVDEADIVKTDGRRIFFASGKYLYIVEAYPPENMRVLSKIQLDGHVLGLFIKGDRLIVFTHVEEWLEDKPEGDQAAIKPAIIRLKTHTFARIYSLAEDLMLLGNITVDGWYIDSRMIENYVYLISMQTFTSNEIILPRLLVNGELREIPPDKIYYSETIEKPVGYTIITAINILDPKLTSAKAVLTGSVSCIYMSISNIYAVFPTFQLTSSGHWQEKTEIYRIAVNELNINCEAGSKVPGAILNQFSMDEYEGYFRIATTVSSFSSRGEVTWKNNLYVLNATNLEIVGRLEGLALSERIYSARFMGKRCYLVTFKKVDPLFTIDLSDPANPHVLGELKIPGYSNYLHPYGENYLIGIGKETVPSEEGNFAWYQGLKISLFNISDIKKPAEVDKIVIGDRGTDSPVLRDHHALLFSTARKLLVIPITETRLPIEEYPEGVPPWAYGRPVFQGAYIFHVSPENGIDFRGRITHNEGDVIASVYEVKRAIYIGDILYTISDGKIKANNLTSLSEIAELSLG
jgi:uncharacterized secreted protein with C-terminal beta-propeller domain